MAEVSATKYFVHGESKSMMSRIQQINALNEEQIQSLLGESERRLESFNRKTDPMNLTEDERVCAIANAILTLAYSTNVPKSQVFAAVAGNMRISMQDAIPASASSASVPIPSEQEGVVGKAVKVDRTAEAVNTSEVGEESAQSRRLTLPSGRQQGAVRSQEAPLRLRSRQIFKRSGVNSETPSPVTQAAPESDDAVYRHPVDASKTWNGKGDMPKWLSDAVSFGRNPEEFRVR